MKSIIEYCLVILRGLLKVKSLNHFDECVLLNLHSSFNFGNSFFTIWDWSQRRTFGGLLLCLQSHIIHVENLLFQLVIHSLVWFYHASNLLFCEETFVLSLNFDHFSEFFFLLNQIDDEDFILYFFRAETEFEFLILLLQFLVFLHGFLQFHTHVFVCSTQVWTSCQTVP